MLALALLVATPLAASAGAAPSFWQGRAEGVEVRWTPSDLTFAHPAQKPFYSFRDAFAKADGCSLEASIRVLSVVGALVSVHESESGYCEGAAHPYAVQTFRALDMRRQAERAKLTDWFPKAEVYKALMGDRIVQKALGGQKPKTLDALLKALDGYQSDDCAYGFSDDLLTRFAFHHLKGKQVAVRLGLTHGCEVNRGQLTQLGLYLPIPPALEAPLRRAERGEAGYLMAKAPQRDTQFSSGAN